MSIMPKDYDPNDPLNPARGLLNGLIGGALFWGLVGLVVWAVTR